MSDKLSLFKWSGLPETFGGVLLVFSLILLLSPYFSGADFGVFKIPILTPSAKKWLRIIGPIMFGLCVFSFLPIIPINPSSSKNLNTDAKSVQSPAQDVDTKTKEAATNAQQESAGNADEELHEVAVEDDEITTRIGDLITLKRSLAASNKITRGEQKTLNESMLKVNDAFTTFTGRLMELDKQPPPITKGNREELALLFDAVVGTVSELIDSSIKPITDAEAKAQLNGAAFSLNTRVRNIKDILEKAKTKG